MERCVRIGSEDVDEPHEAVRRQDDGPAWLHLRFEPQFLTGPGPEWIDDPIAIRLVEPGAVLQNLPPHGIRDDPRLMLPGPESRQRLPLERLRPLVAPADDPLL